MTRYSEIARSIRRVLAVGAVTVASGVVAVHAQEQTQASSEQTLQTVVVTGSMIKRSDFETPSPVQVMTAEDLQQSGYTSVSDVLRNLSANGQGTLSQSFNGAFAGGASGVALRGLTVGATLTLIDGERMVAYPLSDDGERSFVDVSSIPFFAVERVDVLKDGASAEYGSDAIAGVVNVILKKNFSGAQFTADAGTTSHHDGTTEHLAGIWGVGDLGSDGYNAYLSAEYRHQDNIVIGARSGTWTQLNWIPQGGGNVTPGAGSLPTALVPWPLSPGGYIVGPNSTSYQNSTFLPGSNCNPTKMAADQCTYQNSREQIQPQTGNLNLLGRITKNLGGDWQAIVTGSLFRSEAEQVGAYNNTGTPSSPIADISYGYGLNPSATVYSITVPANYPGNPYGVRSPVVDTLTELGQTVTQFVTNTSRLFVNFKGTAAGWDTDLQMGEMYAKTTQKYQAALNPVALQTALNNDYILGSGGPEAAAIAPPFDSSMSNSLQTIDLRGTHELFSLPGGPLSLGLGVGANHRYLNATQSPIGAEGIQTVNAAYAVGSINNESAYAEVVAPVVKGLEVDAAGRFDNYSGTGSATTPKFGVKYSPFNALTFRGTWGKGFRAPNPAENGSAAAAFIFNSGSDGSLCPSGGGGPGGTGAVQNTPQVGDFPAYCNFVPVGLQTTNAALQPEKSTNYTFGFIFAPVDQLNISVDYWDVKINQDIIGPFATGALPINITPTAVRSGPTTGSQIQLVGGVPTLVPNVAIPEGIPLYTGFPFVNASSTNTNGIDLDLNSHLDIGAAGRLTARLNYSHTIVWDISGCGTADSTGTYQCITEHLAGTHGPTAISGDTGNPKDRAVLTLGWDKGPFNLTASINYVGSYSVTDPSAGVNTCAEGLEGGLGGLRFVNGVIPTQYCTVAHFTDVDLYAQYAFTDKFSIHGSVLNLFNTPPPVDLQTYGAAGGLAYNPAMAQAGAVGAFFNIGATYTF